MIGRHGALSAGITGITLAVVLLMTSCGAAVWADPRTRLINLDTARILDDGDGVLQFGLDVRAFDSPDDEEYVSTHCRLCLAPGRQLELIGSFASADAATHDTGSATLVYGGTDVEARVKARLIHRKTATLSAIAGLEISDTPPEHDTHFALHLPFTVERKRTAAHIVPRVVFLEDNTVSSVGLGLEHMATDRLTLMGELTPNIGGANTTNALGLLSDDSVWGVGLRWTASEDSTGSWQIDAGVTNGRGQTSSFSVTPGILNSTAFYVGTTFSVRPAALMSRRARAAAALAGRAQDPRATEVLGAANENITDQTSSAARRERGRSANEQTTGTAVGRHHLHRVHRGSPDERPSSIRGRSFHRSRRLVPDGA
ncbi:MAG: hypothetical protein ACE5JM_04820 [Armatimonadota bacterium]